MPELLRVVIDTNHVMSAILSDRGASTKLIDWMIRDEEYFQLLLSQPIWDEYCAVAVWLIPESCQEEKDRILQTIRVHADWITPILPLQVCADPSDDEFLTCAVVGHADYLVTKDIHHFPYKAYEGVKIVRIRQFLTVLETRAHSIR